MSKTPQTKKTVREVVELLRDAELTNEDRQMLTSAVLVRLGVLPLRASIAVDSGGQIFVNGKKPGVELAISLRESARAMLSNIARKFVRETVTFLAIKQGVHENTSPEQGLFAKAALWQMQEEQTLLELLAQTVSDDDTQDA